MKTKVLGLFLVVMVLSLGAFAQSGTSCTPTPSNPTCDPVVSGKGVVAPPVILGSDHYGVPDVRVVTPGTSLRASEGSPMPVCQPCHICTDSLRKHPVDYEKLKLALSAAFGLS